MSDDDLIRRGDVAAACQHPCVSCLDAIAAIPAVTPRVSQERPFVVGVNHGYETAMEQVAEEARRYASLYHEATDRRNAFTLFAEWAGQAAFKPAALDLTQQPAPDVAGLVEAMRGALQVTRDRFASFKFNSLGDFYDPSKDSDFAEVDAALAEAGGVVAHQCKNCHGDGLVCENHRDMAWPAECECGAGAPCPLCRWDDATAGVIGSALWPEELRQEADKRAKVSPAPDVAELVEAAREVFEWVDRSRGTGRLLPALEQATYRLEAALAAMEGKEP